MLSNGYAALNKRNYSLKRLIMHVKQEVVAIDKRYSTTLL